MITSIDFETRSRIDIKKAGTRRYAMDPSTTILCMAYLIDDTEPHIWLPGQPLPKVLLDATAAGKKFRAWHAQFEISIWYYCGVLKLGWPEMPMERWDDTMSDAAMCGFPLDLKRAGMAVGAEHNKSAAGTRLINLLSKPQKDGTFREYWDHPDLFIELYEYCKQDVRAEKGVYNKLPIHVSDLPEEERIQYLTWLSNERGVPVDVESVTIIKKRLDEHIEVLDHRVQRLTEGRLNSARQRNAMLEELEVDLPNLQNATVVETLENGTLLSEKDRELLEARTAINHASVAKFKKILHQVCPDGTVKDNLQYHGASTGRDAARGFQLQNLVRDTSKEPEELIELFRTWAVEDIDLLFPVLKAASLLIRPMICAPPGMKLLADDFGQVEARGSAWTCKEEDILANFRKGIDPYSAQASSMYHKPLYECGKGTTERQYGKLAILAGGYQGSHTSLTDFASTYELEMTRKEAVAIIKAFRASRPKLVKAWGAFGDAAKEAVESPGLSFQVEDCQHAVFCMKGKHLTMELPNGRLLWFPFARIETVVVKYIDGETGKQKSFRTQSVTCMKLRNNQWIRMGISGGNFFQNYVQAICRDLLMEAIVRLEHAGYEVVGRIHDEAIALVPDDKSYSITQMNRIMCVVPGWAKGFPVDAGGYEGKRYKK